LLLLTGLLLYGLELCEGLGVCALLLLACCWLQQQADVDQASTFPVAFEVLHTRLFAAEGLPLLLEGL
jgi:hypothetical protein